jgi:dTDP-4-dehydrorhamnose 3,5-epimerase-like enzyme
MKYRFTATHEAAVETKKRSIFLVFPNSLAMKGIQMPGIIRAAIESPMNNPDKKGVFLEYVKKRDNSKNATPIQ